MVGQVIWITGLSGSGKTTIAEALCTRFKKFELSPVILDGDILREIFNGNDKNSASYDRNERINLSHKYGLLCKNLSSQGFTVIIATVSMFDEVYAWNRKNLPNYFEVYLDVPLKELIRRDPKNIYKRFADGSQTLNELPKVTISKKSGFCLVASPMPSSQSILVKCLVRSFPSALIVLLGSTALTLKPRDANSRLK